MKKNKAEVVVMSQEQFSSWHEQTKDFNLEKAYSVICFPDLVSYTRLLSDKYNKWFKEQWDKEDNAGGFVSCKDFDNFREAVTVFPEMFREV